MYCFSEGIVPPITLLCIFDNSSLYPQKCFNAGKGVGIACPTKNANPKCPEKKNCGAKKNKPKIQKISEENPKVEGPRKRVKSIRSPEKKSRGQMHHGRQIFASPCIFLIAALCASIISPLLIP